MGGQIDPSERLRTARQARRWSLRDLEAEVAALGVVVSDSMLSQIEEGGRQPKSLDLVVAFEELFAIPVEAWTNFAALTRLLELRSKRAA